MNAIAEEALKLSGGGDLPPIAEDDSHDPGDSNAWVTVATFWQVLDAHLARILLEQNDIDCVILDENIIATDWLYANALGGTKLKVPHSHAEAARTLLNNRRERRTADEGISVEKQSGPGCPKCRSTDFHRAYFQRNPVWAATALSIMTGGLLLPVMLPLVAIYLWSTNVQRCECCGNEWQISRTSRGFEVSPNSESPDC